MSTDDTFAALIPISIAENERQSANGSVFQAASIVFALMLALTFLSVLFSGKADIPTHAAIVQNHDPARPG